MHPLPSTLTTGRLRTLVNEDYGSVKDDKSLEKGELRSRGGGVIGRAGGHEETKA